MTQKEIVCIANCGKHYSGTRSGTLSEEEPRDALSVRQRDIAQGQIEKPCIFTKGNPLP